MIHIEPCRDHPNAKEAVGMMMRMVIARHGCPRVIISDRGTQFDSELWTHVWRLLGTRVALATTHHPQTNGLTERANRTLISLIRKYTQATAQQWAQYLPVFEFAYNSAVHATTKVPPFVAERGYLPPTPVTLLSTDWEMTTANTAHVTQTTQQIHKKWQEVIQLVLKNEEKEQESIKNREDSKRGQPQFKTGDKVLMHWPSFRPYADLFRKHRLRYVGPFTVIKMVGNNAVELEGLPERMPTVINTEYLHPYISDDHPLLESLRRSPDPPLPQREIRMMTEAAPSLGGAVVLEPSEVDEEEKRECDRHKRIEWDKIIRRMRHADRNTARSARIMMIELLMQFDRDHCFREPITEEDYLYCEHDED